LKRIKITAAVLLVSWAMVSQSWASQDGIAIQDNETAKQETETPRWEDFTENRTLDETQFSTVYEELKNQAEGGDSLSTIRIYLLLIGNCLNRDQTVRILEDGFFSELIPELKKAGILEEDYTLPEGTVPVAANISREGIPDMEMPSHDYPGLNEEALDALARFTMDQEERNAYINIPAGTEDSQISGRILSFTFYNMEPYDINFLGEDGYTDISWHMAGMLTRDGNWYDLKVMHDEGRIEFALDPPLPRPATVTVRMPEANTKYNTYYLDGSFAATYHSDGNGYITMTVTGKADSVTVAKEIVTQETGVHSKSQAEDGIEKQKKSIYPFIIGVFTSIILLGSAWAVRRRK
jgi:hypothetical protein